MPHLFERWPLRSVEARNRIVVSPMCQYSCVEGVATPWHLVHLGSRAVGGAGIVFVEATGVSPEGRISPSDMGLWNDAQEAALAPIARFIREQGAIPAIQLAHAGRKASTAPPWKGGKAVPVEQGGWEPVSSTSQPFSSDYPTPRALRADELPGIAAQFVASAARARRAGFELIELHAAHGYLIHQFLSPLANDRTDGYGGSLENRERFALEVASALRAAWPDDLPLWVRLSCTDWVDGGWASDDAVHLARGFRALGIDAIDCSSGGLHPSQQIPLHPGYQAGFARRIRSRVEIPTVAVGLITAPEHAQALLAEGSCDGVALAREMLRDPYWPHRAAKALKVELPAPPQYARAF